MYNIGSYILNLQEWPDLAPRFWQGVSNDFSPFRRSKEAEGRVLERYQVHTTRDRLDTLPPLADSRLDRPQLTETSCQNRGAEYVGSKYNFLYIYAKTR